MSTPRLTIPALVALAMLPAACGGSDDPPADTAAKPAATARPASLPQELTGTWVTRLRKSDAPPGLDLVNPYSVTISPTGGIDDAAVFQIASGDEPLEAESSTPVVAGDQVTLRQEGCFVDGSGYELYDNVYRYRVSGDTLTFTVVRNSCGDRYAESILTSQPFKRQS